MNLKSVIKQLAAECVAAGSIPHWARLNGFSASYVRYVLNGDQLPAEKILGVLGFEKVIDYRKKGNAK